jgi:hypothetical protein
MYVTLLTYDGINDNGDICYYQKLTPIALHRLKAITFIPNPENKPQVNHKDGNKLNNDLNNLEWTTISENIQHSYDNGRTIKKGSDHWNYGTTAKESTKKLMAEAKMGINHPKFKGFYIVHLLKYYSANEAARATGENAKTISRKCKKGEKGSEYFFEFVDRASLLV